MRPVDVNESDDDVSIDREPLIGDVKLVGCLIETDAAPRDRNGSVQFGTETGDVSVADVPIQPERRQQGGGEATRVLGASYGVRTTPGVPGGTPGVVSGIGNVPGRSTTSRRRLWIP